MMGEETAMVRAVNAYKTFGQTVVLNDLNMTVPSGKIYALLGPSGCGKTVLLNCMVGLRPLDGGYIKCGITKKTEVGYMPQDIGLSHEFTIHDTLMFYGRMYGISYESIQNKIKELTDIFEFPNLNMRISELSGGQKRRVSLAVTLIHDARLLLLDEPTVGVDPVLSRNIWEFLEKITKKGITVIITTHYVEEARMAHRIGMMRKGELLVEDSPDNVMSSQNAESLECAFLQLSVKHHSDVHDRRKMEKRRSSKLQITSKKVVEIFERGDIFSWNRFWAQLNKNYLLMKRNPVGLILMLALPLVLSFLLCEAYGYIPMMKVAFVSEELLSSGDVDSLCSKREMLVTEDINCTSPTPFSCLFLESLKKSTLPVIYRSNEEARSSVLINEAWAMMHIPSNFTSTLTDLVIYGPGYHSQRHLDELLNKVTIDVHLDSSNYITNQWLRKMLTDRYQDFVQDLIRSCGLPENYRPSPLRLMEPIYGDVDPKLGRSILPGFVSAWCFYFTLLFTSGAIMMENLAGLVERNVVAGMTYMEMVAAHAVVQTVLIACQKSIMIIILYGIYDHPLLGNPALLIAILFAIEAIGMAYGFFITEVSASERIIVYTAIVTLNVVFLTTGVMWPVEGAHVALRTWYWALPVAPAVEAYKSVAFKGHAISDMTVIKGFVSSIIWIILFSFGTAVAYRAKRSKRLL